MSTELKEGDGGVSLLTVSGVSLIDMDKVDAWLFAIGIPPSERPDACRTVMTDGCYTVSNIEYKTTFIFKQ